jgi:hypothetical protein
VFEKSSHSPIILHWILKPIMFCEWNGRFSKKFTHGEECIPGVLVTGIGICLEEQVLHIRLKIFFVILARLAGVDRKACLSSDVPLQHFKKLLITNDLIEHGFGIEDLLPP